MTYYINPIWIYWMNASNTLRFVLGLISCIGIVLYIGYTVCNVDFDDDDEVKSHFKKSRAVIILLMVSTILAIFLPTKRTCQEMVVASIVTHENVEAAGEGVKEVFDYVIDRLNELNDWKR